MSSFTKFASESKSGNEFGVTNSSGQVITSDYLRRYVHCWCRVSDGFTLNRKANIAYFCSAEFINAHPGKTASELGKIASEDPRWGRAVEQKPAKQSKKAAEQLDMSKFGHFNDKQVWVWDDRPAFLEFVKAHTLPNPVTATK